MSKRDIPLLILIILFAVFLWMLGYYSAYMHCIEDSQAYTIEGGKCVVLVLDGHGYQYASVPDYASSILSYSPM